MPRETIGEFEKLVMMAVLHLGEGAYGATIIQELDRRTGRAAGAGAVYVALKRMEKKGMVTSWLGESSPHRGGRPKRYFRVRPDGVQAIKRAQEAWQAMYDGLEDVLGVQG